MDDVNFNNPLLIKAKHFLISRKNSNELVDILSQFEDIKKVEVPHILAIQCIFEELHKRSELNSEDLNNDGAEYKYRKWLLCCYEDSYTKLHESLKSGNLSTRKQACLTALTLSELDKFLLPDGNDVSFKRFADIVDSILRCHSNITDFVQLLVEHIITVQEGKTDFVWKSLETFVRKEEKPNSQYVHNVISLVDSLPKEKATKADQCDKTVSNAATRVWDWCLTHHHPSALKNLLITLLEHFIVLHSNPIYLTDFLIDSLNKGGAMSLLALQGIYTLILKHNIDYPNIYGKLYTMLQPGIFRMKYKPRFIHLLDLFLTSTHIPEVMAASFVKRLARLALSCAPHDILILLPLIGNLLIRHPSLKKLINNPNSEMVDNDPYLMEENDPLKTKALQSSLWEIKSLQEHVLPSVSNAAMFINRPLPTVEWDLSVKLETRSDTIFDKERNKKQKTTSTTFERPSSLSVPRGISFDKIWVL